MIFPSKRNVYMDLEIPGFGLLTLRHLVLDYNGTLAVDGALLPGVEEALQWLGSQIEIHVLTADTYGSVAEQLQNVECKVVTIALESQDREKSLYLENLGSSGCLAIGNGRNDHLMLEKAALGIALLQQEGLATKTLLAADIVCASILDAFAYFKIPNRLVATLRN